MHHETLPQVSPGQAVRADHINALARAIRKRTPVSSPSVKVVEQGGIFYMELARGGGGLQDTLVGSWAPSYVNSEAVKVTGGSIYDGATTHIVAEATVAVSASLLNYVYLRVDLSPTTTDGYVTGGTISNPTIVSSTSTATNTNTNAYILLFTWLQGSIFQRFEQFSFQCELLNAGVGDVIFRYG